MDKQHYSAGGAIRRMADGGLISRLKSAFTSATTGRKPDEAPIGTGAAAQAKAAITTRAKTIDDAERKAMGMAKGGAVRGKGTGTSDDIPIMASDGEFMLKAAAVKKIGVPALEALNAIADGGKKAPAKKKPRGAIRKMAKGGLVVYDPAKAYKPNFTMGGGAPDYPDRPRVGVNPPGTAVGPAQYRPNFTMGANTTTPAAPDPVTDVRAKFNPANASPEAKAYMADQARNPGPTPGAQPAAQQPRPAGGAVRRAGAAVANAGRAVAGNRLVAGAARLAAPVAVGASTAQTLDTPTEDYETRFGFGPSGSDSPAVNLVRDIGVRALGAASDLGNTLTGGMAGLLYRDKQAKAGQLTPSDPVTQPTAAPAPTATAAPATAPAPAPNPAAPSGAVRRMGNAYSGQNVAGDITINGQAPRGGFAGGTGDGSFRYGGGTTNDAALFEARKAALQAGDVGAVQSSYAAQGQTFGPQVDPIQQLMNNGRPMTTRKAGAIADLQRAQASTQGAAADRKLAQDKFDLERDGAKLDNQGKAQLASVRNMLFDANTTPAQRKSALETYRALTGKTETPNRFTVVPGGQAIDPASGQAYTQPARVIDNQTGQFVEQQGAKGAAQQDFKAGQTYTDARGNKAKWDGSKFVPV